MQTPGTLNARRRTPTMKIRTTALFATAFLAATTAMGNSVTIDLMSDGFADDIWTGLSSGDLELALLSGNDIHLNLGAVQNASNFDGQYTLIEYTDEDGFTYLSAEWSDKLDGNPPYVVAIKDQHGTYTALSAGSNVWRWQNPSQGGSNVGMGAGLNNPVAEDDSPLEVSYSSWSGNPWTGEADPPPASDLPTPVISAFSVTGQSAALSVANVQNGAFYAVYSSETPNGAKTLVECKQCDSDTTVEFSGLDATNAAKFFHVKGGDTQAAASEW